MKFQYLKDSMLEPAKQVVSGLKVNGESYKEAIKLLKERFAKPALIRSAHINEMVNAVGVSDEKQVTKLRSFKDKIGTHVCGLDSMNVPIETYASVVAETLQEQIPQAIRLNMVATSIT